MLICWIASLSTLISKAEELNPTTRANFEWFSTLGFPDVKDCPCVWLEDGGYWTAEGKPEQINHVEAFVLATNAGKLTLFGADLFTRTVANTNQPKEQLFGSHFERVDLREEACRVISSLQNRPAKEDPRRYFKQASEERAEVFVLAWACWRQGLVEASQQLYTQAEKLPARINGHDHFSSFREALEMDFGHARMWHINASLLDPSVSRQEILEEIQEISKKYPHSEYCDQARHMALVLAREIDEDNAHAKTGPTNLISLPPETRIHELIYRLRDQNGHQTMFPGRCDVFDVFPRSTNTPAYQLVNFGYAAVPALIVALESDTPSRSTAERRFSNAPDTMLTVGDCAEQILEKITGCSFYVPNSGDSYMSQEGKARATRHIAEAWWAEFQKKGEKQMLVGAVTAACPDSPAQARLLCQRYPDIATATLISGAENATNGSVRAELVQQIGQMAEPPGIEFLKAEVLQGPYLRSRVAAAFSLRPHDRQTAIVAMIQEWARHPEKDVSDDCEWKEVVEFLSGSDSTDTVFALTTDLLSRPAQVKLEVICGLGETNRWFERDEKTGFSPATLTAIEDALAGSLSDTEECYGTSFGRNNKSLADPRICDLAAWFLSDRWPDHYKFDPLGSLGGRNRQRIECLNYWRIAHALPPLVIAKSGIQPSRLTLKRSDAAKITLIEWSEDSAEPGAGFAARIASLKGKRLDSKQVVGLLTYFAGHPETNSMGLKLEISKAADLKGVRVVVRLIPGVPPDPSGSVGWSTAEDVVLDGRTIDGSSGGGGMDDYAESKSWDNLASAMDQAVSAPAEASFEISARMVADGNFRITRPTQGP